MNPSTYGQLVYNKGGKITQLMKDNLFNIWFWDDWTAICQKMMQKPNVLSHVCSGQQIWSEFSMHVLGELLGLFPKTEMWMLSLGSLAYVP